MLKKIMFTGILLITISVLHAKSINPFKTLISTPVPGTTDEQLVNRIATDKDFKKYYISNVEFANKVIKSGAGSLVLKYIQNKISTEESAILFAKMNVPGKAAFDAIAVKLKNEAVAFYNKFPELKQRAEKEQKELLASAFKNISTANLIKTKFAKARNITPEQCFWEWMACNTLCFIACSYAETNQCYWECSGACGGLYGFCWVIAE